MWRKIILCILLTTTSATYYRLPNNFEPLHYNLFIAYHINKMDEVPFYGVVHIKLFVKESSNTIEMHVNYPAMVLGKLYLRHDNGTSIGILGIEGIKTAQILKVTVSEKLLSNQQYVITIPFNGNITSQTTGVIASSYLNIETREMEHVIYSHFEPTGARSAFPCFDEPHLKAEFTINIAHDFGYSAISNMVLKSQTDIELMAPYWTWNMISQNFGADNVPRMWTWSEFETSKPMSTYLVAWVISKFAKITDHVNKIDVSLWARKSHIERGVNTLGVATKLIPFFENIFFVPFPLQKMDIVALPDFKPVAMENWGLAAYHESTLIFPSNEPTMSEQDQIIELIAHQLAHQWFGDLVTMSWWTDVWLNEGFATLMVYLAKNYLDPIGNTFDTYIALGMRKMLEIDELRYSHPVSVKIEDPEVMTRMFDVLSYLKSALIINMMRRFLGNEIFTKGIHRYFLKYSYGVVTQEQLWDELAAAENGTSVLPNNVTLKEIVGSWMVNPGYPLLTVTRDYLANSVFLTWKRFTISPNQTNTQNVWWIPLAILSQLHLRSHTKTISWLDPNVVLRDKSIKIEFAATHTDWVLFNMDMIAPMRVKYDMKNWNMLTNTLLDPDDFTTIPVLSRTQLLSDSFTLAKVFAIPYKIPLRMVMYLQHETKYAPLETGLKYLWDLRWRMLRDADYKEYLNFMAKLMEPIYEHANSSDARRKVLAINYACRVHLKECEDMAMSLFSKWFSSNNPDIENPIDPVLRQVIYCAAVRDKSVEYWNFLNERRLRTNSVTEIDNIVRALACSEDRRLISRYLNMTLEINSTISVPDFLTVLKETLRSPVGYKLAHDFFLERTKQVIVAFQPHGVGLLGDIVYDLVEWYNSNSELQVFKEWCNKYPHILDVNRLRVEEAIDIANLNIRNYNKNKEVINLIMALKFKEKKKPVRESVQIIYKTTSSSVTAFDTSNKCILNFFCMINFLKYLF